jgi:anti-sigma factor (TIGR02949 family)
MTATPSSTTPAPFTREECESIVRRLWPYLDGKLPESDRDRVANHLSMCRNCSSHFDFAKAFLDAVHDAAPVGVDDESLRSRVVAALAANGFREGNRD